MEYKFIGLDGEEKTTPFGYFDCQRFKDNSRVFLTSFLIFGFISESDYEYLMAKWIPGCLLTIREDRLEIVKRSDKGFAIIAEADVRHTINRLKRDICYSRHLVKF